MKTIFTIALALIATFGTAQVTGTKISDLTPYVGNLNGVFVPAETNGLNRKVDIGVALTLTSANNYFDDGGATKTGAAYRSNNVITGLIDPYTGEQVTYTKVTVKPDGSSYSNSDIDSVIIRKKGTEFFKRNYTGAINAKWFGDLTVTSTLQRAINYGSSTGDFIIIPSGTYTITPSTVTTSEAGTVTVAYVMKANMHLKGIPGKTIFKIANNVSTDVSPKNMGMFFTNDTLSNISFQGITFDMNGQNNPISPSRPTSYNNWDQSPILVSGTPSGMAARMSHVLIENCTFINNPGACEIVVAQSNSVNTILGSDWVIRKNLFSNNGLDASDHTSIFAWADNVICEYNDFTNDRQVRTFGQTGGLTAYEIHGSNHVFTHNKIHNYYRGLWVSSNLTSPTLNSVISENVFNQCAFYGIDFFRSIATLGTIKGVDIHDNIYNFDDSTFAPPVPSEKAAINMACDYGISDIKVHHETAFKSGTTNIGSTFMNISPGLVASNTYDEISIEDNKATGFVKGVSLITNATNGLGHIRVKGNSFTNFTPSTLFTVPIGIYTGGAGFIDLLESTGNAFTDNRNTPLFAYGEYLGGHINQLHRANNSAHNLITQAYAENVLVVNSRSGQELDAKRTIATNALLKKSSVGEMVASIYTDDGNNGEVNGSLTVKSNSLLVGKAGSGTGGTIRFLNDTAGVIWSIGIPGRVHDTTFQIFNIRDNTAHFTMDGTGKATFSDPLTVPRPLTSLHAVNKNYSDSLYNSAKAYADAKYLSGTATLDFPSTTSTTVSDLTITVTGASLGDPVTVGVPNSSVTATASYTGWVSSANTVTVRYSPKATEDPASGTFKVTVFK